MGGVALQIETIPFRTKDNLSVAHWRYRSVRAFLVIPDHRKLHIMIAAAQNRRGFGDYISKRQACADADAMLIGINNGTFEVEPYVTDMVDLVFNKEIDLETFQKLAAGVVVDFPATLARSEKERRKTSSVRPSTHVARHMHVRTYTAKAY
ncbi:MAG TPA: hypothetical protein VGN56_01805 [Candidatus Paceibacterota bacterium]|jgi:hypothetical protein|nr:hypothetical protein [Candidatus Paceibacterota bacterium]